MCVDPVTMLTIGSTVVGAVGSVTQGIAAQKAANYNAKIAEMNAELSQRQAKDAIERGQKEEQRKRMEVAQIRGQQKVAMAANGVDLGYGSPLDIAIDTAVMGELDALTIRSNANREAYDFEVQAVNQRAGANLARMEGKSQAMGSYLGAAGTVLGGAAKSYESYLKYKK